MSRFEPVKNKSWRNDRTGATASIYGAHPSNGRNDADWCIVENGYSIRDNVFNTVLTVGALPFNCSLELAQKWCDENNIKKAG